jgi:predicted nucleic acid-binding protein
MRPPLQIITDSGPLFDFLLGELWITIYKKLPTERLRYIKVEDKWKGLKQYFHEVRLLFTTPSVIVEIEHLIRRQKLHKEVREMFWKMTLEVMKLKNLREELIRLIDMPPSELPIYGPADVSIIEMCRKTSIPVFTADSKLWHFCKKTGLKTIFIYELFEVPY